jgi:hypothetical protein
MNKVFPRKWYKLVDRSMWGPGPWDAEEEDREQWSDSMTGYPCLAIRCEIGVWAGYVGVYPDHPAFGERVDDVPGNVCDYDYTDAVRFIEPWPEDPNACVDVDDPKESILSVVRMPDYLWWFGFDFAHAGDLIPGINAALRASLNKCNEKQLGTYKDLAYVKKTCAAVALGLCRMSGTKTMDSTRQRVFASST